MRKFAYPHASYCSFWLAQASYVGFGVRQRLHAVCLLGKSYQISSPVRQIGRATLPHFLCRPTNFGSSFLVIFVFYWLMKHSTVELEATTQMYVSCEISHVSVPTGYHSSIVDIRCISCHVLVDGLVNAQLTMVLWRDGVGVCDDLGVRCHWLPCFLNLNSTSKKQPCRSNQQLMRMHMKEQSRKFQLSSTDRIFELIRGWNAIR